MIKYVLIIFFLFFITDKIFAQLPPIQLDRPDQTECPNIVPEKYIQVESGFTYEKINKEEKHFDYPASLIKYGLNDRFEYRLIVRYQTDKMEDNSISGFEPITLGFKANYSEEHGLVPMASFIGHITTSKVGSKGFQTTYIKPAFRFTMQHTLSKKSYLGYNFGAEWDGETPVPTYVYTLTTGTSFTEKLGGYIEFYGFAPVGSKANHRFDCGLTQLLNNDLLIDLSGGFGLTENAPDYYVSLGISFRFKTTK